MRIHCTYVECCSSVYTHLGFGMVGYKVRCSLEGYLVRGPVEIIVDILRQDTYSQFALNSVRGTKWITKLY